MRAKSIIAAAIACFLLVACGEPMSDDGGSTAEPVVQEDEGANDAFDVTQQGLVACGAAGSFVSGAAKCCQGLVKDANSRCQYPTCKAVGAAGIAYANGTSNCCFGLALVGGVCRKPTLSPLNCTILDKAPTANRPCCVGLAKDAFTGLCKRNTVATCSSAKIATCCYGTATNTCNCYCPNPYYIGM
jgi:hypothetical protein